MAEDEEKAKNAVFMPGTSNDLPTEEKVKVKGYDFDDPQNLSNGKVDFSKLLNTYLTSGFQATNFGLAQNELERMLKHKFSGKFPEEFDQKSKFEFPLFSRNRSPCTIFLGFTSNLISSGVRDTMRFLAKNNLVDCIVTTAGGVEEDFIKVLAHTYIGDFKFKGESLRKKGLNRIGNLIVPNENYCKFENWIMPIFEEMADKQDNEGFRWTPSSMIHYLGEKIGEQPNGEDSVWYWCWKNKIPVFSPALTDGSLGDMLYFFSYKRKLELDIIADLRYINTISVRSAATGILICGGGLIKHHIANANLMRNGANYSVYINTATEFDGSDSGASPDEAVSWGKIRMDAKPVKLVAEVSLVLPLLVAQTFFNYKNSSIE